MTRRQYRALAWAVGRAAEWRGSLVGNPDEGPLETFDAQVKLCREALKAARRDEALLEECNLTMGRALNWLSSYPGGNAQGCYDQVTALLKRVRGEAP